MEDDDIDQQVGWRRLYDNAYRITCGICGAIVVIDPPLERAKHVEFHELIDSLARVTGWLGRRESVQS